MKMGWMLTGGGFPREWQRAWASAWQTIASLSPVETLDGFSEADQLDVVRHAVQITSANCSKKATDKALRNALDEVKEKPVRELAAIFTR